MEILNVAMYILMWLNVFTASICVARKNYGLATFNALIAIIIALQMFSLANG